MRREALSIVLVVCGSCGRSGFGTSHPDADADADVDGREPGPGASLIQVIAPPYVAATVISSGLTATAGSLLVAAVFWDKPAATITLADSANLVWTEIDEQQTPACPSRTTTIRWWYAAVDTSVTTIVSATQALPDPLGMFVAEYAGLDTSNPLHAAVGLGAPSATNTMTTPALVTAEDTAIVAAFADSLGGGTMVPGTGWSARAFEPTFYWMLTDNAPRAAAGTYTPSGTLPAGISDACWVAAAAAFRLR